MSRRSRWLLYTLAGLALMAIVIVIAGLITLRSDWFREKVRTRIITEVEKASGGRVDAKYFDFDWRTLHAEVRGFTLHGKERAGEPVFLSVGSVQVGLKIISVLKKEVDIASAVIDKPEFHFIVYPDGTTNLPSPQVRKQGNFVDSILKLKIRHYEVKQGIIEYKQERVPIDIRGDNLSLSMDYDVARALYRGNVSAQQLHIETIKILPLVADFSTALMFDKDGMTFQDGRMAWRESQVLLDGTLRDWKAPLGEFNVHANVSLPELGGVLRLPLERRGRAAFEGKATIHFVPTFEYDVLGKLTGHGLAYRTRTIEVAGIGVNADAQVTPAGVKIPHFVATALGGTLTGHAALPRFNSFTVKGDAKGLALAQLDRFDLGKPLPWSGAASGPVEISGLFEGGPVRQTIVHANLNIVEAAGGIPVAGAVELTYDQKSETLQLGESHVKTRESSLTVSGTLGQRLAVNARSTNLNDVLPVLSFFSDTAPREIPVRLDKGTAVVDAVVTGPFDAAQLSGKVNLTSFVAEGKHFDSLSADVTANQTKLTASNLVLRQGTAEVAGLLDLGLSNWRASDSSSLAATLRLRNGDVQTLLKQAGSDLVASGAASADIVLKGTFGSPQADAQVTVSKPAAFGEQADRLRADIHYSGNAINVSSGELRIGPGALAFSGAYKRSGSEWSTGSLEWISAAQNLNLEQLHRVREYRPGLQGLIDVKATGKGEVKKGEFDLASLDSEIAIRNFVVDGAAMGNATATARTRGGVLDVKLDGNLRGSKLSGSGEWRLAGNYPGKGEVQLSKMSLATIQSIFTTATGRANTPQLQGSIDGHATISGPLKQLDQLTADITLDHVEFTPSPDLRPRAGAQTQDLVLRNLTPVSLIATRKFITIRNASFIARDTRLDASGRLSLDTENPWDLKVNGSVNLAILQLLNADLLAQGNAVLNASITGPLRDPQVGGRLELRNASLYLGDLPVGLDNAAGAISFDRNRANIEKLTAEVGGGKVAFGGFIGFNADLLLYRVQASADQVRIRYPEGVSTTLNAALDLTGTSKSSLVSGTLTVIRAGFTPKADLGSLLAQSSKPISAPVTPNEYLRNVSFDVRVESGPSLTFQTSLTRDLQAEVDLRLRGNAAQPALVGDVSVNEGEINVFGNKYTINRGEVRFLNPNRIEPIFDIDLETKARGITVNLSFSGTLTKLNVTYRSDPPLQTSEIVALLAVGRDPTTSAALANSQAQSSFLESGSSVIGQAITQQVTSRLQRFFGVTRLKIDPQLTGVENIPQARLTLEQQVRRDLTLTYITNLTRTQEQIVRVQWDISKEWSAIAVREENGVFGIDFQYRKRFK